MRSATKRLASFLKYSTVVSEEKRLEGKVGENESKSRSL